MSSEETHIQKKFRTFVLAMDTTDDSRKGSKRILKALKLFSDTIRLTFTGNTNTCKSDHPEC